MSIAIYVLLGLTIVSVEVLRVSRRGPIDALAFFNFFYFLFFVFVPINVMVFGEDVVRQKYAYDTYGQGDEVTALCLLLCYVLFLLGYVTNPDLGKGTSPLKMRPGETYSLQKAAGIALVFFCIGMLALWYAVSQVGGLLEGLREAGSIRSGEFALESRFVFIRQFIPFLSCAFLLYLAVYLAKKTRNVSVGVSDRAILFLMAIPFIYSALASGGRRDFIYPVLLYFLVASSAGRRFGVKTAIVAALALVAALASTTLIVWGFYGIDDVASYRTEIGQIVYLKTVQGIADSYVHFVGMQHADLWQFGLLRDIVGLPFEFVPSRLLEFERGRGMLGDTSQFFLGDALAADVSGEEPPGFHGYLLVNFGYAGMFLLFFLFGAFYRFLHNTFKPIERTDALAWLIYWWVFFGFLVWFREGVLAFALKQQAPWWLAIALLILTRRRLVTAEVTRVQPRNAVLQK